MTGRMPCLLQPNPDDARLTRLVSGVDQDRNRVDRAVTVETPLTLFLNDQEIVTMMTIGDYPDYLALGYLLNQGMLAGIGEVTGIDHDEETSTLVVRTVGQTDYEEKLRRRTLTSGCAQGTVFGDLMEDIESLSLDKNAVVHTSWLHTLTKEITTTPSLYLKAGAIHGCVLCEGDRPLVYMEDVGRHNAVDKVAGYMATENLSGCSKIFYTTGRLTSEMVIKTARMNIPCLISRSGFTAWGVELARQVDMTLIGRLRGKRFMVAAGAHRVRWDDPPVEESHEP